jgi:hypothetical protein
MAISLSDVVQKGLEKKGEFMDTDSKLDSSHIASVKAEMRFLYVKFLQSRDSSYIVDKAMKKAKQIKNKESINFLKKEQIKYNTQLQEYKKSIESLIEEKVNIKDFKPISFKKLKNISLDELVQESYANSDEIRALESYFNKRDEKKDDNSWKPSISYDVMYGFESAKNSRGARGSRNEVEVGISIDFTKGGSQNDSSIEVAKKRRDLELKKSRLKSEIKELRDMYIESLKSYKNYKEKLKKIDTSKIKTKDELKKAYESYMLYIEAKYNVFKRYIALMQVVEQN